jgi:hypothetical protein
VDVEASFPTHREPTELVQQGESLLDDVAQLTARDKSIRFAAFSFASSN